MAVTVYFYRNFKKRINSTAIPDTSETTINVLLKENCSEHDPILKVNSSVSDYNYAYIPSFGKYYFVTDVVFMADNYLEYHLAEDVLATYNADIRSLKARIAFSSVDYDTMIVDPRICVKNSRTITGYLDPDNSLILTPASGQYVLTVFNKEIDGSTGMSCSYAINQKTLDKLRVDFAADNMMTALYNYFQGDPLQAIYSLVYVPYSIPSSLYDDVGAITIGNQIFGVFNIDGRYCHKLKAFSTIVKNITLQKNLVYSDFRKLSPYTTAQVFLPGIGAVDVSLSDYERSTYIHIEVCIEVVTGHITYIFTTDDGAVIQTCSANVATNVQLGRITSALEGAGREILSGAVGAGKFVAGAVGALFTEGATLPLAVSGGQSMIDSASSMAFASLSHGTNICGSVGSYAASFSPYVLYNEFAVDTEDCSAADYITEKGRPNGKICTIGDLAVLGGRSYVQCEGASISCKGNAREKQELNGFLNSGFFLE